MNPPYTSGSPFCTKCGKPFIYVGDVPAGGWAAGCAPYCEGHEAIQVLKPFNFPSKQPWICPRCNKVNAPHMDLCAGCSQVPSRANV